MKISLSDAGKRFNRDWVFRHFTYQFEKGNAYAITGPNGSGKSTLLQVLSGGMHMSEGNIQYSTVNAQFSNEEIYKHVSVCAPYLEVVEEMTLTEFLQFHNGFKPILKGISIDSIISAIGLEKSAGKQIRYYSSGMKQRVKLAQCIFSDSAIVLLDEPCTNLDTAGIALYQQLVSDYRSTRLVIVSSNEEAEYSFCRNVINITNYK